MLLLFVAILAMVSGAFDLRDRINQKALSSDGVVWRDDARGVIVSDIEPGSPAVGAGIQRGDIILGIDISGTNEFEEITEAQQVQIYLDQAKDQILLGHPLKLSYLKIGEHTSELQSLRHLVCRLL